MGNKFSKYLGYTFLACIVLYFVLNSADVTVNPWVPTVKLVCFIIGILCALIYASIMIYCIIDNKKISKLLDNDKYDELLAYANKKASKKSIILSSRHSYYEYLQLLCYLAKDEEEKIDEYFEICEKYMFMYPMTYYWKAIYDFTKGDTSKLNEYFNDFKNSPDIIKGRGRYDHLVTLLYSLVLFNEGKVSEAKVELAKHDTSGISMPATRRAIKMIEEAEITEKIETIQEETQIEE